ncbi:MAG: hypothetical protein P1U49_16735 [Minwuia sp.]|nr:hypothetical protein [Minwuia sp.]
MLENVTLDDPLAKHLDLLRYYHDMQIGFLKHYEDSRTKISQIILALSAALIGLSRFPAVGGSADAVGPLVIILGLAGIVFSLKYTSLANRRTNMARALRREMGEILQGQSFADIETVYRQLDQEADSKLAGISWIIAHIQVRWCWIALHAFVAVIGFNITF